ncbi:Uncharacterized conserved protein, DUF885 familyt [Tenacibaculum sp. MAR_2010_89]|uniref:DUF885 domain-containing protein n=1 Tax=Tenacibaculum sp. MAR_2010_89 TaxID=1250198 RepID=UPI00089B2A2E|nr:DUF885 domain-containing protein [Tenacibaculum sp. MAR_2010_89]SEE63167.1 Uncharacterized conserved protein, DUF885 familyt [Tenacibaculum sp. MAR_2010_89]
MKNIFVSVITATLLFSSCKQEKKETTNLVTKTQKVNTDFDNLLKEYNERKLRLFPISATQAGDVRYNDKFPNSLLTEYTYKTESFYDYFKSKLESYKNSDLSESQQMSKAVLAWDCDIALAQNSFKNDLLMPINQMWTINLTIGQFASGSSSQPFKTVVDYKNWLLRLDSYNNWLKSAKERMQEGIKEGYILPKSLIKKVIPQFKVLANTTLKDHLFYTPIKNFPSKFSNEEKEELSKKYTNILNEKLIPSFKSLYNFLKTDYLKAGRKDSGIDGVPQGKEYYQHAIKKYTTTTMTADEIHNLGLNEVGRILSEMEKVKEQVGFKGSLKDFFNYVRENKELMPYTTPKQIIDNFNAIHEKMKPQLEKLFGNKPKTGFIVKQTEKFREASASAEYNSGSLDGTRPGVFYTPIPDATKYNVFSDEALFLHEAIPGHHYQISLTQENKNLPDFRKTLWYSAYGEGWALYTENLGKELGLYTDPYQYFGMLGMEMHRAIRLVVDTGMHAKGWSREKAIEYSLNNEAESEASIISEIERYMANPGQALSYKIGQLKIRELRAKAKKVLGDKFDIREFHNQILETGCIPLALLENKINKWITSLK